MFTVEQVELARRLKNTGITIHNIQLIFDSLDELDKELDNQSDTHTKSSSTTSSKRSFSSPTISPKSPKAIKIEDESRLNRAEPQTQPLPDTPTLVKHLMGPLKNLSSMAPVPGPNPFITTAAADWVRQSNSLVSTPASRPQIIPSEPPAYRPLKSDMDFSMTQNPDDLRDLLKNGEEAAIVEMRNFVNGQQLRQTAVAAMSGISQPYISKFLNGNYKELSARVRTILFSWFVSVRNQPANLTMGSDGGTGSQTSQQRRERYVFRPSLLNILENHFQNNAYPNLEKRMEIATQCNRILQSEKQGNIGSKELVSAQVVANWFANKRKEVKKRISPGGTDLSVSCDMGMMGSTTKLGEDMSYGAAPSMMMRSGGGGGAGVVSSSSQDDEERVMIMENTEEHLKAIQSEMEAVNSSLLALVNPYQNDASPN